MSYGSLLHAIPEDLRAKFRKYESICKKQIHAKWSAEFNKTCIKENILPTYSKLRHHDPAVSKTEATLKYRRYLVQREITCKEKKLKVMKFL